MADSYSKDASSPGYQFAANPLFKGGAHAKQDAAASRHHDSTLKADTQLSSTPMKKVTMRRGSALEGSPHESLTTSGREALVPEGSPLPIACLSDNYQESPKNRHTVEEFPAYTDEDDSAGSNSDDEDRQYPFSGEQSVTQVPHPLALDLQSTHEKRHSDGTSHMRQVYSNSREGSITARQMNPYNPLISGPASPAQSWTSASDDCFPWGNNEGVRSPATVVRETTQGISHLNNYQQTADYISQSVQDYKASRGEAASQDSRISPATDAQSGQSTPENQTGGAASSIMFPKLDSMAAHGGRTGLSSPGRPGTMLTGNAVRGKGPVQEEAWSIQAGNSDDGAPQRQARPSLPFDSNKKEPLTNYATPGGKSTVPELHQTKQDRSSQRIGRKTAWSIAFLLAAATFLASLAMQYPSEARTAVAYSKSVLSRAHGDTLDPLFKRISSSAVLQEHTVYSLTFMSPVQLLDSQYRDWFASIQKEGSSLFSRIGELPKHVKTEQPHTDTIQDSETPSHQTEYSNTKSQLSDDQIQSANSELEGSIPSTPVEEHEVAQSKTNGTELHSDQSSTTDAANQAYTPLHQPEVPDSASEPQADDSRVSDDDQAAHLPIDSANRAPLTIDSANKGSLDLSSPEPLSDVFVEDTEEVEALLGAAPTGETAHSSEELQIGQHGLDDVPVGDLVAEPEVSTLQSGDERDLDLVRVQLGSKEAQQTSFAVARELMSQIAEAAQETLSRVQQALVRQPMLPAIVIAACGLLIGAAILLQRNPQPIPGPIVTQPISPDPVIESPGRPSEGGSPSRSPKKSTPKKDVDEAGQAKQTPATWLASKLTPNRISRIEADGDLDFRQLRARTIVTAQGKQVGDLDPKARLPGASRKEITETPEPVTTRRMTRRQPSRLAKTASKYY